MCFSHKVNRQGLAEFFVVVAVDKIGAFLESVNGNDHNLNIVRCSEVTNFFDMVAIIDKSVIIHIAIQSPEMFPCDVESFLHAFFDGDTWHDDDKFGKAVSLVEFQECTKIHIGFSRAGFHFDVKVEFPAQGNRLRQTMPKFYLPDIFQNIFFVQFQTIANALPQSQLLILTAKTQRNLLVEDCRHRKE